MNKIALLCTTSIAALTFSHVATAEMDFCFKPYIGADAQIRHMPFQRDFGGNALKRNYPTGNFFAGLKLNDYVGVELGYEISKKKSRTFSTDSNPIFFGISAPLLFPNENLQNTLHSSTKIQGWNFNLMGFLPVVCDNQNNIAFIGSVGITNLRIKTQYSLIRRVQEEALIPAIITNNSMQKKQKAVLRLSGGMQSMITDCIGIRGLITWENTSKFQTKGTRSLSVLTSDSYTQEIKHDTQIKSKNSIIYGLGVFSSF